jgi:hypothetical protein
MSLLQPVSEHEREHLDALLDGAVDVLVTRELLDEADRDAAWRALRLTFDAAYALGDNAHARRLNGQPRPPSLSPLILPPVSAA